MGINDEKYMAMALEEAKTAFAEGEVPVGAIVVLNDEVIAKAHNTRETHNEISGHAEIKAIEMAEKALGRWTLDGCTLYVTLEPCLMCSGAIMQSRIKRVVFGSSDEKKGAVTSNYYVFDDPKSESHPLISKGVLKEECGKILKDFFSNKR
ncbi:MAG: nucleoside deaminase [Bacilli bacterium]|nr:nucleoside deaminase [Bacilli bacterium]